MNNGYYNVTNIEPIALAGTLILSLWFLLAKSRNAFAPVILLACFLPVGQRIVIAELDFTMLRVLLLIGWLRILMRGEFSAWRSNALDRVYLAWALVSGILVFVSTPTAETAVWSSGRVVDMISIYVIARSLIRDAAAIERALYVSLLCTIPLAAVMAVEATSGRNLFAIFGGVPEITVVRGGRLRCQGAFSHPIMAGTLGASLAPIAIAMIRRSGRHTVVGALTLLSSTMVVVFSASSGPVLTWLAGVAATCLWPLRHYLRPMRWGLLATVIALHIVMKAPVWHLISRVDIVGGSTGHHRYRLIDAAIDQFPNWWLFGTATTANWGFHLFDVTNHYVLTAVHGGIWGLGLFVAILSLGYRNIGRTLKRLDRASDSRYSPQQRKGLQYLFWGMGACLFSHTISFIGVSYFGQIEVFLFSLFAMTSACEGWSRAMLQSKAARSKSPSRARMLLRPTGPGGATQPTT